MYADSAVWLGGMQEICAITWLYDEQVFIKLFRK